MTQIKERYTLTQSQKMMVFILSMSLYGLSNMITELVPEVNVGPVNFSIEYFAFIPLTLCILFHPFYAAIGASFGEIIFGEIMLGQFSGFGEMEKLVIFTLAMYVAGIIVNNPKNRVQVGIAAVTGVVIHQFLNMVSDIAKVWIGVEDFEAVSGLPQSVVAIEGFSFLNDVLFSGILFALLPTLYLVPRLYGKIEPLLGMKPCDNKTKYPISGILKPRFILVGVLLSAAAMGFEFLSEAGIDIFEWEADFGSTAIWISLAVAAVVALITIIVLVTGKNKAKRGMANE
ncbi:cell division protein FtsQ [Sporolactobacillus shoreicorticis]|uniref:Cell division protein FtsQ n=1 Tax=Sporolactobacillus shoreicorticis TaxID=1923877 RepID=A0ABW5S5Y1_9BACL|nr:cell division protein FtsQ [Sporolactobacillus shoreicorticis]MCO7127388.1 cell division protein FtsQ [Sporolactobacillus shoreicorticis]